MLSQRTSSQPQPTGTPMVREYRFCRVELHGSLLVT